MLKFKSICFLRDPSPLRRQNVTRNTLDDQSNLFTLRTLFSPSYLLNLIQHEIAPFDPPTSKTPPYNQTWSKVDRMTPCGDMAIWIFPNERSVVGRWSVGPQYYTSSYTDLIYSSSLR